MSAVSSGAGGSDNIFVRPLEEATDAGAVGGKAWNLARMLALGLRVPPGCVVTDAAFQAFLSGNRLKERISALSAGVRDDDIAALRRVAGQIRAILRGAPLPAAVSESLRGWRARISGTGSLIVRSSAVGEDSAGASFAGQLDSFAGVESEQALEDALRGCWTSAWSERALHYQRSRGVRIDRMGVVIQRQVEPKAAGVLFTRSPDPDSHAEMIVEYCAGHGEKLVSGRVNPGRIAIAREAFRYRRLADPEDADGGAAVPSNLLDEVCLRALQRIGLLLEREFQGPQDIEWALDDDGGLHLVQSRPVTAAQAVNEPRALGTVAPARGPLVVWSNANINENYPGPVSPLLHSIAIDGYYHYFHNLALAFGICPRRVHAMEPHLRNVVGAHGARLYYNLSNIHNAMRMAPFGEHLAESFNLFVGAAERTEAASGGGSFRGMAGGRLARLVEAMRIFASTGRRFLLLEQGVAAFEHTIDEYAARTHPRHLESMALTDLHVAFTQFLDIRCNRWTGAAFADAASMVGYGLLKHLVAGIDPAAGEATLHNRLLRGLKDLVSAGPVHELWLLSRTVRGDAALSELFRSPDNALVWQRLQREERFAEFASALADYLERWGFRCSGELMLTVPSFQEDPQLLLPLLRGYAALEEGSPGAALETQSRERVIETLRVRRALAARRLVAGLPWPNPGTLLGVVLRWTQRAIALRERARLKQSLLYSRCRRVVLRIGAALAARRVLSQAEDVFFLTHREIDALLSGGSLLPGTCAALVALRRAALERCAILVPPESLALPRGESFTGDSSGHAQAGAGAPSDDGVLTGTGACGGSVTAPAAVLADVSESARLHPGDVLVARQTDPGWAPLFFMVRGLVMERGGMLSHAAIIAREYGIPTVVGVRGATTRIAAGRVVTVDGDAGLVRLVD